MSSILPSGFINNLHDFCNNYGLNIIVHEKRFPSHKLVYRSDFRHHIRWASNCGKLILMNKSRSLSVQE